MTKRQRKPASPVRFTSLQAIADHYGRAKSAVYDWTQHGDWPCRGKAYDAKAIEAFYQAHIGDKQQADSDELDDLGELAGETDPHELLKRIGNPEKRIKLLGVIERAAKVRVDRELALGGYLRKEDVEAGRVARIQAVRAELANIRLLALKLENKTVPDMEQVLEAWAQQVCQKFEQGE